MLRKIAILALLLAAAPSQFAQSPTFPPEPSPLPDASQPNGVRRPPTPEEIRRQKELEKERTKQRYQDIRHDTQRLVALANELKQDVDQAGEQTLSLAVVKKADEIEKLAKSVKQRMKGD